MCFVHPMISLVVIILANHGLEHAHRCLNLVFLIFLVFINSGHVEDFGLALLLFLGLASLLVKP